LQYTYERAAKDIEVVEIVDAAAVEAAVAMEAATAMVKAGGEFRNQP